VLVTITTHERQRLLLGLVLLALIVSGCSRAETKSLRSELRPAEEVEEDRALSDAGDSIPGLLGESIDLGDGVSVTLSDPKVGTRGGGSWLDVAVRAENAGSLDQGTPALVLVCADGRDEGSWYSDSSYQITDTLPAGSFREGRLFLVTDTGDSGYSGTQTDPPACGTPATVKVWSANDYITVPRGPSVTIPIPDGVIEELNAKRFPSPVAPEVEAQPLPTNELAGFVVGATTWPDTGETASCMSGSLATGIVLPDEVLRTDGFCGQSGGLLPFEWVICTDGRFLVLSPAGDNYPAAWWFRGEPLVLATEPPQDVLDTCLSGDEIESDTGGGRLPI
jgi:hypothetical protein